MIESGSFSGKYDKEEKGVGSKPQIEVLDDSAVLKLIVDGGELFVPAIDADTELKKIQNKEDDELNTDFNDGPTLA